jgi:acyl dehydratase
MAIVGEPLWLEDFEVGRVFETGTARLGEDDIVAFARAWDPQPMHLDPEAARKGVHGGLIASGFQTIALAFRLFVDTGALAACSVGGAGMSDVRWRVPVRPGDVLRSRVEVVDRRPTRSGPDRGMVRLRLLAFNQRGEEVLCFDTYSILLRRPPS